MKKEIFLFDDYCILNGSNYIFQITGSRKLTSIYHCHNFFEIIMILEGNCLHLINDKEYQMSKGEFVILCPKDYHCFIRQSSNVNVMSLSIKYEEFLRFAEAFGPDFKKLLFSQSEIQVLSGNQENFDIIYACTSVRTEAYLIYQYKYLLCSFIKRFSEQFYERSLPLPQDLANALKLMYEPENIKKGLSALLSLSNYSHSHLSRLMKTYFHMTLHEYILNLRLEKAYHDIVFTQNTLEDISESVGYSSFSHFNRIFKQKYDITPSVLRKTYNKII